MLKGQWQHGLPFQPFSLPAFIFVVRSDWVQSRAGVQGELAMC